MLQYAVVYYEKDGNEVYQFRVQADIVTVPDHEILQVSTRDCDVTAVNDTILLAGEPGGEQAPQAGT